MCTQFYRFYKKLVWLCSVFQTRDLSQVVFFLNEWIKPGKRLEQQNTWQSQESQHKKKNTSRGQCWEIMISFFFVRPPCSFFRFEERLKSWRRPSPNILRFVTDPREQSANSSVTQDAEPINLATISRNSSFNLPEPVNQDKYFNNEITSHSGNSETELYSVFSSSDSFTSMKEFDSDPVIEEASMGPNVAVNDNQDQTYNVPENADRDPIVVNTQDDKQQTDDEIDSINTDSSDLSQAVIVEPNVAKSIWKCNECNKVMPSRDQLRGHKRIHLGAHKFYCSICGYQTNLISYYRRHAKSHNKAKQTRKESKTNPVRKNARTKPEIKLSWECGICQKVLKSRANLRDHKRIHGGSYAFNCDRCDYQTDVKYFFERHLKSTHKKKPAKLKCGRCDFTSSHAKVFEIHEGLHANKKAIKCDMCDYLCISKRYLHAHLLRVHVPTKRHQCAVCAYTFNCIEYLRRHIRNVHLSRDD